MEEGGGGGDEDVTLNHVLRKVDDYRIIMAVCEGEIRIWKLYFIANLANSLQMGIASGVENMTNSEATER